MTRTIAGVIGATALAITLNLSTFASASQSAPYDPYHYFSFNPYTPRPATMPPVCMPLPQLPELSSPQQSPQQ